MKGLEWLLGALVALGTVVLAVLRADLEDSTVCQWLARKLIYRAAQRLPREERARWREEWIRHELDVPGRLLPLVRALDIYCRAGSWGRMLRGAPSPSQVLIARIRAAWQWLRSLPTARSRARALSKQLHPAFQASAEPAQATAVALDPVGARAAAYAGILTVGVAPSRQRGMPHLSDADFVAWLAQERQQFEEDLDRRVEEYRLGRNFSCEAE
jgi:hypothetical protein